MLATAKSLFGKLIEITLILLMVGLTIVVLVAVAYRLAGNSLSWYDEIASILLAWITYYGSALAALRRGHIGFDSVLLALPRTMRIAGALVAEVIVIGFMALMTWAGLRVLSVLEGEALVSLTWMPVQLTQSVIPIGAALFIVAELLSLPDYLRSVAEGHSLGSH
ncbi:MAG: TRAP transporter small permease subunit [Hyphomicrobiaceae bacterium]|nr:TRAP transporter small permease subunit [Hyphomicrobiaceae bacterium]